MKRIALLCCLAMLRSLLTACSTELEYDLGKSKGFTPGFFYLAKRELTEKEVDTSIFVSVLDADKDDTVTYHNVIATCSYDELCTWGAQTMPTCIPAPSWI